MSTEERPQWGSKLGFILAAAGSAVGLGSVWRFPWYTGTNGGAAFVLIYLVCVLLLAIPVQWLELSLGRHTQKNPVGAFKAASHPQSYWKLVGYLGLIVGIVILSYYSVVAGWTAGYIVIGTFGELMNPAIPSAEIFTNYAANPWQQVISLAAFMALSAAVVLGGVKGGIERVAKVLMPVLVVLLLALIIRSLTLPQASAGLSFYLVPDFSQVTMKTILLALGQAFYAMSLGMGAMLTYGSYLDKKEDLAMCGTQVALFVAVIALMAGFIVFPALGGAPTKAGPGLVFIALVDVFRQMPMGGFVAVLFFILLAIAALTSTISLFEVVTAYLVDERKWTRPKSVMFTGAISLVIGIPSALSIGANKSLTNFITWGGTTKSFLDIMDYLFGNIFLMLGVLLLCLFAISRWGLPNAMEEIARNSKLFSLVRPYWKIAVTTLAPIAIILLIGYMIFSGKAL